jgi:hypothetical protein
MHTSQHKALELRIRQVGPWSLNAYALTCPQTRESLLIDPGDDPAALTEMLTGTRPRSILVTHGHPDHIGALDVMRGQAGCAGTLPQGGRQRASCGGPLACRWRSIGHWVRYGEGSSHARAYSRSPLFRYPKRFSDPGGGLPLRRGPRQDLERAGLPHNASNAAGYHSWVARRIRLLSRAWQALSTRCYQAGHRTLSGQSAWSLSWGRRVGHVN